MNENYLINKYFSKLVKNNPLSLDLNDDVFYDQKSNNVISVDTYVEKTHFPNFKNPGLIIKKIIRASISDLICKGVTPKYYFLSGSGDNKHFNKNNLRKISNSLKSEQKKYSIKLSGGDTVYSEKVSFTVMSLGFSKKIIKRNNGKINDDIYVTGDLGDSYVGLNYLQKKNFFRNVYKKYFIQKFYLPTININFSKHLSKYANTSIDISDGLLIDLVKMLNKQNLSSEIYYNKIPLSKKMTIFLKKNYLDKKNFIFNGDDYQILFSAPKCNRIKISKLAKITKTKISRIGKVTLKKKHKFRLLNGNKSVKLSKMPGYEHNFF